jgi:hypothetical protein
MFSLTSSKKDLLARKALFFFFTACLVMGMAVFSGCATDDEDTGTIVGKWVSSYSEEWDITATTVTTASFAGTIENDPNFEAPAGVIIIKYTTPPQYNDYDSNPPYDVIAGPFDPPGDYYAIYWKSLTATSIEIANAWDVSDWSHNGAPEAANLDEAVEKFTLDKVALWVGGYSACEKQ